MTSISAMPGKTDGIAVPIAGPHLIRYGTAGDQKFLLDDFLPHYDQLVINARMVAHIRSALASFLIHRAKNKPYLIDPETHAFQHRLAYILSSSEKKNGELKRSVRLLVDAYGAPLHGAVIEQARPVVPDDFSDPDTVAGFADRVLTFQAKAIASEAEESPAAKYYQFRAKKGVAEPTNFRPTVLVAPYFYLEAETFTQWLPVNLACFEAARAPARRFGIPLAMQITVHENVVRSPELRRQLLEGCRSVGAPDLFLLWLDNFPEGGTGTGMSSLEAAVALVGELGDVAPVVNLHGGYLSVALMRSGTLPALVGVAHGLEYGESRSVIPVGGGVPSSKFYLPALHARLIYRDAVRAVRALGGFESQAAFFERVCNCAECQLVIEDDPDAEFYAYGDVNVRPPSGKGRRPIPVPTPATKGHCVRHYLWRKAEEYAGETDPKVIAASLRGAAMALEEELGLEYTAPVQRWAALLDPAGVGGTPVP